MVPVSGVGSGSQPSSTNKVTYESPAKISPEDLRNYGMALPVALPTDATNPKFKARNEFAAGVLAALAYQPDAKEVRAQLASWGFTDVKLYGWNNEEASTQAIVARRGNEVHVIFRGTHGYADLAADGKAINKETDDQLSGDVAANQKGLPPPFLGAEVHRGFRDALDELWHPEREDRVELLEGQPPLLTLLQREAATPGTKLVLEGHSLGGALAALAAGRLSVENPANSSKRFMQEQIAGIYTFGMPHLGNDEFKADYDRRFKSLHHLVKVPGDVVSVLPKLLGYTEVGTEVMLDEAPNRSLPNYTVKAHLLFSYLPTLKARADAEAAAEASPTLAWRSGVPPPVDRFG